MPALVDHLEIRRQLERIDWDFVDTSTPALSIHSLHWFPGNFIPQIPMYLIQALSQPNDLVVDPFCGSGTTAIEAVRLGRRARQSDTCQASIQVARAKAELASNPALLGPIEALQSHLVWEHLCRSDALGTNGEGGNSELLSWYAPDTLCQLRYVWQLVQSSREDARAVLEAVFSDVLFAVASLHGEKTSTGGQRRHHWGWVADNVVPKVPRRQNAVEVFRKRLQRLESIVKMTATSTSDCVTEREDARELSLSDETAHLVVTSPPYLGMIDYVLSSRLTYLWMNWNLRDDMACEIGARRRRNKATEPDSYIRAMQRSTSEIHRILKAGGHAAIVVGTSRRFPEMAEKVLDLYRSLFTVTLGPVLRTPSRRRVSERSGSASQEYICVFRK